MLKISDYEVNQAESERWGTCPYMPQELRAYNGLAKAKIVFHYLNRPQPNGVADDEMVDIAAALPELMTLQQMADKAQISIDDAQLRHDHSFGDEDVYGKNDADEDLFYWECNCKKWMTEEMITANKAAEVYGIDRRTAKNKLNEASEAGRICDPIPMTQGERTYNYYWGDEVKMVLQNE